MCTVRVQLARLCAHACTRACRVMDGRACARSRHSVPSLCASECQLAIHRLLLHPAMCISSKGPQEIELLWCVYLSKTHRRLSASVYALAQTETKAESRAFFRAAASPGLIECRIHTFCANTAAATVSSRPEAQPHSCQREVMLGTMVSHRQAGSWER